MKHKKISIAAYTFLAPIVTIYTLAFSTFPAEAAGQRSEDISRRITQRQQEVAQSRQRRDELVTSILEKEKVLERNRVELADANTMLREAEDRYQESLIRFNERISTIYKLGEGKFYAVLLSSEDFSEAVNRISYLATISESDLKLIDRIKGEERELRALRGRVDSLKQAQAEGLDELYNQKLKLDGQIAFAQKEIDADLSQMTSVMAREQEEEALLATAQANSRTANFGPGTVLGPSILAGSSPPEGLKPTGAVLEGIASWYGPGFHGNHTANGETYDMFALTAAHKTLPFGTWLKVTYGGRSVFVRINDRGPYIAGRFLDLSAGSARAIGLTGIGFVTAEIYH